MKTNPETKPGIPQPPPRKPFETKVRPPMPSLAAKRPHIPIGRMYGRPRS